MSKEHFALLIILTVLTAFTIFTVLDSQRLYQDTENKFSCPQGSTVLESSIPTNSGEKTCIPIDNYTEPVNSSG